MSAELRTLPDAVADLAVLVEADGARLHVVELDDRAGRVHLRLDLDAVECLDCVMPSGVLLDMFSSMLESRVGRSVAVVLDDPRDGA